MQKSPPPLDLKLYRALLLVGGIVIIAFGPIYQLAEPGIVDPVWVRLGIGLSCLALVGLTFLSKWLRESALLGIYALFYVVSAWQLSLTYLNDLSVNTTFGMMLVIFGCSVGFRKPTHLAIYSGFVIVATTITAFMVDEPQVSRITYLLTLSAIATLGYFVLRSRLRMVDELRSSMNASDVAVRAKGEFLATMSHEIRTPMNGVIGMTTLLTETELTPEQQDYVDTIRVSGESLLTIINDILDFSKIEAEKIELEEQPFELRQCIEEALDLLTSKAAEHRLELAYSLDESVPETVKGDVTRLRQILVNLLGNAVKFTENGEVVISVVSRAISGSGSEALHELQFAVRDTGIGIPEDRLSRLFTSFSQIDSSTTRKYGGTGLGLAISRRLAELMGGTMWVESTVGQGSTFYFTVIVNEAVVAHSESLRGHQPQLKGRHVLIVDDNETNRKILQKQSNNWGMETIVFPGARAALEWVDMGGQYDLAILDMQMPEMDGMALAEELRSRESVRERPLIMLSSVGKRIRAGGVLDAALTKPVKQSQLFDVLSNVVLTQERIRGLPQDLGASRALPIPEGFERNAHEDAAETWLPEVESQDAPDRLARADEIIATSSQLSDEVSLFGPTEDKTISEEQIVEVAATGQSTQEEPGVPPSAISFAEKQPLRILMAEDNAVNQKVAIGILKRLGYTADVVANGLEVLKALELADYDVILMDVQMPEMDGLEATRHIRQTVPREKRPRIVAMTANAMQGDRERCLEAGMDDYVPKPLRHGDLTAALAKCSRIVMHRKPPEPTEVEAKPARRGSRTTESILDRAPQRLDFNTLIGPKAAATPKPAPEPEPAESLAKARAELPKPPTTQPPSVKESRAEPPPRQAASVEEKLRAEAGEPGAPVQAARRAQTAVPMAQKEASQAPMPESELRQLSVQDQHPDLSSQPVANKPDNDNRDVAARAIPEHIRMLTGVEDLGFAEEVLDSYLRADTLLMRHIGEAHARGDAASVAQTVHKLKSSSGVLGATRLAGLCAELERHARAGSLDGTAGLCHAMAQEVDSFSQVAVHALDLIRRKQLPTVESL